MELLARHDVPLIEDDVYRELHFGREPVRPAKFFDRNGLVIHCGSFAKCLAPGYRIGWAAEGRFARELERAKWMTTLSASVPAQRAIADYLQRGDYHRFLHKLRRELAHRQSQMLDAIRRSFPPNTVATSADGGYFTWVELPDNIDSIRFFQTALENGISIAPGPIFSARKAAFETECVRTTDTSGRSNSTRRSRRLVPYAPMNRAAGQGWPARFSRRDTPPPGVGGGWAANRESHAPQYISCPQRTVHCSVSRA